MNPWLAFFLGVIFGEFAMLFLMALLQANTDRKQGVEADTARYMMNQ